MWSSSVTQTSVGTGGWSTTTTEGTSPGGGTGGSRGASRGGVANGGVRLGAEARSAMREQVTWVGVARAWSKTSEQLIIQGSSRRPISSITIGL
jgi:hypothetical protein